MPSTFFLSEADQYQFANLSIIFVFLPYRQATNVNKWNCFVKKGNMILMQKYYLKEPLYVF